MNLQTRSMKMFWLALLTLSLAGVLAACGGSDETLDGAGASDDPDAVLAAEAGGALDVDVRPFAEIQVGEEKVEIVNGGTGAIVTVVTSLDTVCSVAFGETEALGQLATDRDMGGVGHSEHLVILNGLRANETYSFKFSGSDANGVLYQSREFLTFTTDPDLAVGTAGNVTGESAHGNNIVAEATIVDSSSEFSEGFAAGMAIDGDITTEWSTAGDGDDGFVTLDFGRPVDVGGVAFKTRAMSDGSAITQTFSVVVDGGERLGPFEAGDRETSNVATATFTGQVLRFEIDESTGGNTGAIELEVFERAPLEILDGTNDSDEMGQDSMNDGDEMDQDSMNDSDSGSTSSP